jgi:hypothetical protein
MNPEKIPKMIPNFSRVGGVLFKGIVPKDGVGGMTAMTSSESRERLAM